MMLQCTRTPMPEPAWCTDRLVGVEELGGVGERPFLALDAHRAAQAQPGPPPPHPATAAQGHELAGLRRQLTAARCDLSCQRPITPGGWQRKAREGRSAARREDPIHLGAATRQREGAIRRAERRRQWAEAWEPQSGSALAETGRLSASERPSKVRNRKTGPRGWWPGPKGQRVGSPDRATGDGDINSRRTTGRSRPGRTSPLGNRVSPTRPVARRKPDRKGGGWRRG